MPREVIIPGGGVVTEEGEDTLVIPGQGVFQQDQPADAGDVETAPSLHLNLIVTPGEIQGY